MGVYQCKVVEGTAVVDVYQWLRKICGCCLINHDDMSLSGNGPLL